MDIFGLANSFSPAGAGDIFRNLPGGRPDAGGETPGENLGGIFSGPEGAPSGNVEIDRLSLPDGIPSTMDLFAGGRGRGGGGTGGLKPDDEDLEDPTTIAGGRGRGGGGTGGLKPDDEDVPDPTRLAGGRGGGGGTYGQAEPVPVPDTMYT